MDNNTSFTRSLFISLALFTGGADAQTFNLHLDNGTFFGPGSAVYNDTNRVGMNTFVDAQVRNIVLTGPLIGFIPFFNNGAAEPNVIAEKLQAGGVVDGLASDGTLINENADTGLRLNFRDPATGESADVMVVAEFSDEGPGGGEPILPDALGNLTFSPSVLADPGQSELVSRFNVSFTTGAAQIPLSLKTRANQAGGQDNAGPLSSGKFLVGRMGDSDHNGFLDGVLVLAANAPLDLVVGRGNPIAQVRPWSSDIPIDPVSSSVLELNGVARNFSQVVQASLMGGDIESTIKHLQSSADGIRFALENLRNALRSGQLDRKAQRSLRRERVRLLYTYYRFTHLIGYIEWVALSDSSGAYNKGVVKGRSSSRRIRYISRKIQSSFKSVGKILQRVSKHSQLGG